MKRLIDSLLKEHVENEEKMLFLSGPRQVGKTTAAESMVSENYFSWDNQKDRRTILKGPDHVAAVGGETVLSQTPKKIAFDEIHKYGKWKSFLKGFYDGYKRKFRIIVTGSSRLNIYKKGGDSLMGRYFLYRLHPLSVGELTSISISDSPIKKPTKLDKGSFNTLFEFGGFPEPFLKANRRFHNRWMRLRLDQLFQEDLRDLSKVQEIGQIQVLAEIMDSQVGQLINYSSLANEVNVSVDTIRRWISILESFYYCFTIKPWNANVPKSLRKQPKAYLWDWSRLMDPGARTENFIASHLLKAVHWWTDIGLGNYELFYLRDKLKREVDFLISKDRIPWFIVEVKTSNQTISKNLTYFKEILNLKSAFQIVINMDYIDLDCFSVDAPVVVPAKTFLSQLV